MSKTIGITCIIVCIICILWELVAAFYTIPGKAHQYRFDGVYAAEGTVLTVEHGELSLLKGSEFSVERPLRRIGDQVLGGLCFLLSLVSGIVLLRAERKKG